MSRPSPQEIQELVRRLETDSYDPPDIREAGELLASALPADEAYGTALKFWDSEHGQVRLLGLSMMRTLAPDHAGARGFVAGARGADPLPEKVSDTPDYSAIGEVIKAWMREYRKQKADRQGS